MRAEPVRSFHRRQSDSVDGVIPTRAKSGPFSTMKKLYFRNSSSWFLIGAITVVALAVAFQQYYIINLHTDTRYSLLWHIPFNLFYFWYWFMVFPIIRWLGTGFKHDRHDALYWAEIYFVFPLGLVLLHQVAASLAINVFLGYLDLPTLLYKRILRNPWLGLDVIIYFVILITVNLFEYQRRNREEELRLTRLQGELARSQLNALESQLHPHFLFNTLNAVSTLILKRENSEAARMLLLLGGFLKTTIYGTARHVITLGEELEFINQYLEIEKIRFADRLKVVQIVDPEAVDGSVPNFLLQPLVENAVRHAIAPQKGGGTLSIIARRIGERLQITVADDGPGLRPSIEKRNKEGVGLRITKERLSRIFHDDHSFVLDSREGRGLAVRIDIPFVGTELTKTL